MTNNILKDAMVKYEKMQIWRKQYEFFNLTVEDLPNFSFKGIAEEIADSIYAAEPKTISKSEFLTFKATKSEIKIMTQKVFGKIFFGDSKNNTLFNKLWNKVVINPKLECPILGMTCGNSNVEIGMKGDFKVGIRNIEINRMDTYYAVVTLIHEFAHSLLLVLGRKSSMYKHVMLTEYFPIVCEKLATAMVAEELQDERFYHICNIFRTNEIIKYEKFLRAKNKERERLLNNLKANQYTSESDAFTENFMHEIVTYETITWLGYIVSDLYAMETVRLFQENPEKIGKLFVKVKNGQLKVETLIETLGIDINSVSMRNRIVKKFKDY